MKLFGKAALTAMAAVAMACETAKPDNGEENPTDGSQTSIEDLSPEYRNASLVYYGDGELIGTSDYWTLALYTEMEVLDGNPVGPGQMMVLTFNSKYNPDQSPRLENLAGTYHQQASSGDFSAGTFMPGWESRLDTPDGYISIPTDSHFGDIPEGETEFEPDYLREGTFTISDNGDGTFTIEGTLVGTDYLKRYVYYSGPFSPVDRHADGEEPVSSNSTLEDDVVLDGSLLTKASIIDYGASYTAGEIGAEPYRKFVLYLAEDGVELTYMNSILGREDCLEWPSGNGRLLRLELFVNGDAEPENGIPAGTYEMLNRNPSPFISRDDIVPFRIVEGEPDVFTNNGGTWYEEITTSGMVTSMKSYARITGGTMEVSGDAGAQKFVIELTDCSDPSHKISCTWESNGPIPAYDRNYYD